MCHFHIWDTGPQGIQGLIGLTGDIGPTAKAATKLPVRVDMYHKKNSM